MVKIKTDTIIRTVVLGISLINQIIVMCGLNPLPFADDEIYAFVSTLVTVAAAVWSWWKNNSITKSAAAAVWSWWKNNSITKSAQAADEVKNAIKSGTITANDAEALVKSQN